MKLRFEVTVEDLAALHMFYMDRMPAQKTRVRCLQWGPPLILLGLAINHFSVFGDGLDAIGTDDCIWLFLLVLSPLWIWRFPQVFRNGLIRNALTMYSKGSTSGLTGSRELELTPTGLASRTTAGESLFKYSSLLKIVREESHVYVFINSFNAYVIPRHLVIEGNLDEFLDVLESRMPHMDE
jgi:hypothetical protein